MNYLSRCRNADRLYVRKVDFVQNHLPNIMNIRLRRFLGAIDFEMKIQLHELEGVLCRQYFLMKIVNLEFIQTKYLYVISSSSVLLIMHSF